MSAPTIHRLHGHQTRPTSRRVGVPVEQGATIVDALLANGRRCPNDAAMHHRSSGDLWETTTWAEYLLGVRQVAGGRRALLIPRPPGRPSSSLFRQRPRAAGYGHNLDRRVAPDRPPLDDSTFRRQGRAPAEDLRHGPPEATQCG
jgi:hypothetical protein